MQLLPIIDIPYRLTRKYMPACIYIYLRNSIGRSDIINFSRHIKIVRSYWENIQINGKIILEIGPGNDITTAILLVLLGAKHVYLVDKISENPWIDHNLGCDIQYIASIINRVKNMDKHDMNMNFTLLEPTEIASRITQINSYFTDSNRLFKLLKSGIEIDSIVSYTVLEHVDNIDELFINMKRILGANGTFFHLVDLSDHAYHIFSKYPVLNFLNTDNRLQHLRYSDETWKYLNDSRAIEMNRKLLPLYLEMCSKFGFTITNLTKISAHTNKRFMIHDDVIKSLEFTLYNKNYLKDEWLQIHNFRITGKIL